MSKRKGGPGSGRHAGSGELNSNNWNSHRDDHPKPQPAKPHNYAEKPSTVNPGKPRSGVSPRDLFPERYNKPKS